MVDTCFPIRKIVAHQVQLEFIQRPSTRSGAEVNFAARVCFLFGNTGRKIQYPGEVSERRNFFSISGDATGANRRKGNNAGLICVFRQWIRINGRIDLEGKGVVLPIKIVRAGADAPLRMFGGIVVLPCPRNVAVRRRRHHEIKYNETAFMKDTKQNIRYLGFESIEDGARKFDFAITGAGRESTRVSLVIPALMFTGVDKITFQESAKICYEKLRVLLNREKIEAPLRIRLTGDDIAQFRHVPRGRQRFPKA